MVIWVSADLEVDAVWFDHSDSVVHSCSNLENGQGKCELLI
jgi:hypothetical protein